MADQNEVEKWQKLFQAISMPAGAMRNNAHTYWSAQADILNEMHAFTEGWFQRRHIGTQAAQEACERMCEAKTPMEWMREYHLWSMGALQRLMADGLAFQQEIKRIADEVGPSLVPSLEKEQGETVSAPPTRRERADA